MENTATAAVAKSPSAPITSGRASASQARRNELAIRHHGLVERVVRRMGRRLPSHIDRDDLIAAGMIGLLEAADRFDPARGEKFESFAEFRIRGAILDDLRERDSMSRDMRRVYRALNEATNDLTAQLGRSPEEAELAAHLGLSVDEIRERRTNLSGASVVSFDDVSPTFLERRADDSALDPCGATARREVFEQLAAKIDVLPEKMRTVLSLYYCEDLNLKEIGAVLGVTESRACQLHREATRRLRHLLGDDFAELLD
jgi:RNA polymerase sigma factor for flagellar operon FliA